MKKLLLFIAFITIAQLNSQSFSVFQVKVEKGGEQALLKLFDDTFGDKEFKSGGVQIESIHVGDIDGYASHRIAFIGDPSNWGTVEEWEPNEFQLFWSRAQDHFEWKRSSSGNFLSYDGGAINEYPYYQIYEISVEDPSSFKSAHDKLVNQLSDVRDGRPVALGNFSIGGNGASHWVAVGAKNWQDLMIQKSLNESYTKEWQAYYNNRGNVEGMINYSFYVVKSYGDF
jgi:hypothetical protein|tara:strand:+ start:1773 stop:2456 length:684 start_codon:yes stop_codon:yes gene_type:complete